MKNSKLFFLATILFVAMLGCTKEPTGVTLTVDKTTVSASPGNSIQLTVTSDSKCRWYVYYASDSTGQNFTEMGSNSTGNYGFALSGVGVHKLYVEAYRRPLKGDATKPKGDAGKSNEVSITVTP